MSNTRNDYARLLGAQMTPIQMLDKIEELKRAALYQAWQPIETVPNSKIVLVHYKNANGNSRIIKARYVKRWTEECSVEFEEGCGEYSEEKDEYYITEGWWEQVDNWPEWCEIRVDEGEPDAWMEMPKPPKGGEQ